MKTFSAELEIWADGVIEYGFYGLFIFVPLVLTPWNFELFEFNKMVATYGIALVILAAWLVKMIVARRFIFKRTAFDIPLLIFLGSQVLSTIFSIDPHTSIFGYYSRFHGGLLSTMAYLVLFWAMVSNLDKEKVRRGIYALLGTAAVVAIYGVLEHLGIDKHLWVQDVQNRVFSTLGQPNWLAAWLVALLPLTWSLVLGGKDMKRWVGYCLSTLFFLTLLYTKSRSGLFGWGAATGIFWVGASFLVGVWQRKGKWRELVRPFLGVNLPVLLLILLSGTPWTPSAAELVSQNKAAPVQTAVGTQLETGGSDSGKIRKIVWQGAIDIWRAYPVFGSGVETFAYSYYNFRPRSHNDVSEWDFLYNKAHNEYLNFAATTGTVGLVAYLAIIGWFVGWSMKNSIWENKKEITLQSIEESFCLLGFLAGFVSIAVTGFFGFSVVPVALLFFLYPAMGVIMRQKTWLETDDEMGFNARLAGKQKITLAGVLILAVLGLFNLGKYWYGDVLFAKGGKLNRAGSYEASLAVLNQAVNLNEGEPSYKSELAEVNATLAVMAMEQNQSTSAGQLAQEAITQSNAAVAISPRQVNFWKDRTVMFFRLAEIDPKFLAQALSALLQAEKLAPTDAKISQNLGVLYYNLGEADEAVAMLEKTINLKPNYKDAYVALTVIYEKEGKKEMARDTVERWLVIDPGDEQFKTQFKQLLK